MRRTFNMNDLHVWGILALVLGLVFTVGIFFYNAHEAEKQAQALEEQLIQESLPQEPLQVTSKPSDTNPRIREEYEQRFQVVAEELGRLYDLEKEVRVSAGLPVQAADDLPAEDYVRKGGLGGNLEGSDDGTMFEDNVLMHPPRLLDDTVVPSVDLLLEEVRLRSDSMKNMMVRMEALRARIDYTPSIWPTDEKSRHITSKFGRRLDPITRKWRNHGGVDIYANYGTPIVATADGTIVFSGYHQYLGNLVRVDHGNTLQTWYGHMSKRLVETGQVVEQGQMIGKVGSTGRSTGAHIHYEVHMNGSRVDPKQYISN